MFWQANVYKKVDNRTEIISQIDETVAIETGTQTYTEQVYLFCSMETVLSYSLSNHNIPDIHTKAHPMVTLKIYQSTITFNYCFKILLKGIALANCSHQFKDGLNVKCHANHNYGHLELSESGDLQKVAS